MDPDDFTVFVVTPLLARGTSALSELRKFMHELGTIALYFSFLPFISLTTRRSIAKALASGVAGYLRFPEPTERFP